MSEGLTALHLAVDSGDLGVFLALVAAGADVNARTYASSYIDDRHTPLHLAAEFRDVEMVKILVEAGADINAEDERGVRPFHQVSCKDDCTAF